MNEPKSKIRGRDLAQGRSQDSGVCQVILYQEKPFEWIIHFDRKCAIVFSSTAEVSFTSSRLPIRHRGDPGLQYRLNGFSSPRQKFPFYNARSAAQSQSAENNRFFWYYIDIASVILHYVWTSY